MQKIFIINKMSTTHISTKVIFHNAVKTISTGYTISYMIFCWWMGMSLFMHNSVFLFGLFSFFNALTKRIDIKNQGIQQMPSRTVSVSSPSQPVTNDTRLPE